jgi:hypothetical protein
MTPNLPAPLNSNRPPEKHQVADQYFEQIVTKIDRHALLEKAIQIHSQLITFALQAGSPIDFGLHGVFQIVWQDEESTPGEQSMLVVALVSTRDHLSVT